jgi:hypothetical protein
VFVVAQEYDVYVRRASGAVIATTVLSIATLTLVLVAFWPMSPERAPTEPLMERVLCRLGAINLIGVLMLSTASADAGCVTKGGRGKGTTVEEARVRAWESILQSTSWPMWIASVLTSGRVGQAAGYRVGSLRQRCSGRGQSQCVIFATLCTGSAAKMVRAA